MNALLLLAVAASGSAQAPVEPIAPRTPLVQATATVRIVSGERITAGELPRTAIVRDTKVRGADGIERDARIVEFP